MDIKYIVSLIPILLKGAVVTIELTVISVVFGTIFGLFLSLMKISNSSVLKKFSSFYIYVIRGTPLLLQLFAIYYGLPFFGINLSPFLSAVTGMSLNSAAYIAEIIRAGIESIDKGQMEAAKALGMSYYQAMRRIILPQAFKRIIPPMGNEFIALLKDSSLVSSIAMTDLMRAALQMYSNSFRPVEVFLTAGILYLVLTTVFTMLFGRVERRMSIYE